MSEGTHPSLGSPVPAGWYPDPAGGEGKRWWDGGAWTHSVQEPEATPAPASFSEFRPAIPLPAAEVGTAYTRESWWIAGSPLWVIVPQAALVQIFNSLAPLPIPSLILGISLFTLLAWLILIRLAFGDRSGLVRGGNNTAASPWWMLLTPLAYLIVRARQVQLYASGGWASVIWWCLAAFITPGIAVLAIFAVYGLVAN
jgi:hypothetical protein